MTSAPVRQCDELRVVTVYVSVTQNLGVTEFPFGEIEPLTVAPVDVNPVAEPVTASGAGLDVENSTIFPYVLVLDLSAITW